MTPVMTSAEIARPAAEVFAYADRGQADARIPPGHDGRRLTSERRLGRDRAR
jgi:hypothetical protein